MTFRAKVSFLYSGTHESKVNKLNVASSIHAKKVAFTRLWLSIQSNVIALGWSTVHSGAAGAAAARHSSSTTTHRRSDGGARRQQHTTVCLPASFLAAFLATS